jgi:uncharacterized protein (DUF302 family)
MTYALTTTVAEPYDTILDRVREALGEQGFGVLTEIDVQATLKKKLDVDVPPQTILGACRPALAHAALQVEPSLGLLLPCNVVVRAVDDAKTVVEAVDPQTMVALTANPSLQEISDEAAERLRQALDSLAVHNEAV